MITDDDKERVRQATDFVQLVSETVELRQRGQDFWGCCPFHGEKTPSFKVNPSTGLWHCFGCDSGGDVFNYVQRRENFEFPDAIRYLADRAGIELAEERGGARGPKRSRLIDAMAAAEDFYHLMLMRGRGEGSEAARAYLGSRGMGAEVCKRWKLGYAPGRGLLLRELRIKGFSVAEAQAADLAMDRSGRANDRFFDRVMFPIHDELGRPIAFGGRVLQTAEKTAKYVNTRDTRIFNKGKHLFAYDCAKEAIAASGEAIVCEGYTDVIAMHEAGMKNVVAALGTAFRLDHIKLIERQRAGRIICLFDGDAAGQRAAERAVRYLDKTSAALMCVVLPDGQDPMEFLSTHSADELREILEKCRPLMDFVLERRLADVDISVPGLRVRALEELARVLAPLKETVLLDEYAHRVADALRLDAEQTKQAIKKAKPLDYDDAPRSNRSSRAGAREQARDQQYFSLAADYDDDLARWETQAGWESGAPAQAYVAPQNRYDALSADDRAQREAEIELVCAIAQTPDSMREYIDRIGRLTWYDERNQTMAWAMLATPPGTAPQQVVEAARAVEPSAPEVLSAGRVASLGELEPKDHARLVVDAAEYHSCRRRVRQIRSELAGTADGAVEDLFKEATELQQRANELGDQLRILAAQKPADQ